MGGIWLRTKSLPVSQPPRDMHNQRDEIGHESRQRKNESGQAQAHSINPSIRGRQNHASRHT